MPLAHSSEAQTRVILVRHGQSTYNAQGRYQGASDDAVLTEKGVYDAYQTGLFLQAFAPDAIYTSPLKRAKATAAEISSALSPKQAFPNPPKIHPALKEIDLPEWQGLSFRSVREQYPDAYRCWKEHPERFQMALPLADRPSAGAEAGKRYFPVLELFAQAQQFWQLVLPHHIGQTIVIVSHGGTIRALIETALGIGCEQFHSLQQSNCGVSVLMFDQQQTAHLTTMNDTAHLGEVLPKLKEGKHGVRLLLVRSDGPQVKTFVERIGPVPIDFWIAYTPSEQDLRAKHGMSNASSSQFLPLLNKLNLQSYLEDKALFHTGVLVGCQEALRDVLSSVLGMSFDYNKLCVQAGAVTAIHYPSMARSPVLQALNFSVA